MAHKLDKAADAIRRGESARREKRYEDARAAFAEASAEFRHRGLEAELAHALTRQAQIERDTGNLDAALRYQLKALSIGRALNGCRGLAHTIRHVADILQEAGRHGEADPYYREMLELYDTQADVPPLERANAFRSFAIHQQHLGNDEQALSLWLNVRDRYRALDDMFLSLTGIAENPGVKEADARLAALTLKASPNT
jgi:tetratricopeptide (TPR) repeat protein